MDPIEKENLIENKPEPVEDVLNNSLKTKAEGDLLNDMAPTARIMLDYMPSEGKKEFYEDYNSGLIDEEDINSTYDLENKGPVLTRKKGLTIFSVLISTIIIALGILIAIILVK